MDDLMLRIVAPIFILGGGLAIVGLSELWTRYKHPTLPADGPKGKAHRP